MAREKTVSGQQAIQDYIEHSAAEQESAKRLANSLEPWRELVPPGPVLEAGAGTGLFTEHILSQFPNRSLVVADRSEEMIAYHKKRFGEYGQISRIVHDLEADPPESQSYAMICGNHVAHQFANPSIALENLSNALKIGGLMLMGFPGEDSFKEWRSACLDLGIPYTGKSLPQTEPLVIHLSMGPFQVDFYEDQSIVYYDSFYQYLQHCINGGSSIQKEDRTLTKRETDLLNSHWKETKDGKIGLTYHNVFLAIRRIDE
jgi:malonyl-CoA O-methyltransferase